MNNKFSSRQSLATSALYLTTSLNLALRSQLRLSSGNVLTVSATPAMRLPALLTPTTFPQKVQNHYASMKLGAGNKLMNEAAELSLKKQQLMMRSRELTQHLATRSDQAMKLFFIAGARGYLVFNKLKVYGQHLASYPKISYLPLLFFACGAYGFNSVETSQEPYTTIPLEEAAPRRNPISDFKTFKQWLKASLTSLVIEVVASGDVKKQGLSYLERMFKNKQVHESLIILLKGGVKDNRFVDDSKKFGIDWIAKTITAPKSKDSLKELVNETFVKDQRVIQESVNVAKYFVAHPQTKELSKQVFSAACLQKDTLDTLVNQMRVSGNIVVQT